MTLRELINQLPKAVASGDLNLEATSITADSRAVAPGSIFVAIRGGASDGHSYIDAAVKQGATAIVAEVAPPQNWGNGCVWVHCSDSRIALALLATALHGTPSAELKTVGVTGTNGKTTTTYLVHHIMRETLRRAGLLGTIQWDNGEEITPATHTTPAADVLQAKMAEMVNHGCRGVAMEVSSHGVSQHRVTGVQFDVAVFTNLTQDHLDYHGNMDAYYEAKKLLFTQLSSQPGKKKPVAVINLDDRYGEKLVKELRDSHRVLTYGQGAHCDYKMSKMRQNVRGSEFQLDCRGKSYLVRMPLIGRFNVYNALAAIAATSVCGIKVRDAVKALAEAPQVPGRMEHVGMKEGVSVFVDYAHTPDALTNVCSTLRELNPRRLITVFGCGGDRDQAKRPLMGEAASAGSDLCLITSDNPRSEDPEAIIKMIEPGMLNNAYRAILDREEAIRTAVNLASSGDIVLVAGKGHESYQQFADETIDFDDRRVARWALRDKPVTEYPTNKDQYPPRRDR